MSKRALVIGTLAAVVLGAGVARVAFPRNEPAYDGIRLSAWLDQLNSAESLEQQTKAEEAIRHMGVGAIPSLRKLLRAEDTETKKTLEDWLSGFVHFTPASEQHAKAFKACAALGTVGRGVETELIRLLQRDEDGCGAAHALFAIRTEMISPLANTLTNHGCRGCVAEALGELGPPAAKAVIPLAQLLKDPDESIRHRAVWALGRIHSDPETSVPALLGSYPSTNVYFQAAVLEAVGKFGRYGKAAIPMLVSNLVETNVLLRSYNVAALNAIDPQAASRAGVSPEDLIRRLENGRNSERLDAINTLLIMDAAPASLVPALSRSLQDPVDGVRLLAAFRLRKAGTNAIEALPALERAATDDVYTVRVAVTNAMLAVRKGTPAPGR